MSPAVYSPFQEDTGLQEGVATATVRPGSREERVLAGILCACLDKMEKGAGPDEALRPYPGARPALRSLLELAGLLRDYRRLRAFRFSTA